jgi:hypothetical protein
MRNPRDFAKPLAVGAPAPLLEIPVTPSRMIHFFDPSNEKMRETLVAEVTSRIEDAEAACGALCARCMREARAS